jgi:hypothetical protein
MTAATSTGRGYLTTVGAAAVALSVAGALVLADGLPFARAQTSMDRTVQPLTAATRDTGDAGRLACGTCGVVEAVRVFEVRADAQSGGEGQKPAGARTSYRVTVRMTDGSYRTLAQPTPPAVGIGDRVRVADGTVVRDN